MTFDAGQVSVQQRPAPSHFSRGHNDQSFKKYTGILFASVDCVPDVFVPGGGCNIIGGIKTMLCNAGLLVNVLSILFIFPSHLFIVLRRPRQVRNAGGQARRGPKNILRFSYLRYMYIPRGYQKQYIHNCYKQNHKASQPERTTTGHRKPEILIYL